MFILKLHCAFVTVTMINIEKENMLCGDWIGGQGSAVKNTHTHSTTKIHIYN